MEVYIIDFGLSNHMSEGESLIIHNADHVGTPGYFLGQLVNFYSKSAIEQQIQARFNHGFSSSIFNDRVAMSKMIAELMMGPVINKNVLSHEFKWYIFNYKSWIEWFVNHKVNECVSTEDHRISCLFQRQIWDQYIHFNEFLVNFTNPELFHDEEQKINFWMNEFVASIKTNTNQ